MSEPSDCGCDHYYLFTGTPECLHKLFRWGVIKAITREVLPNGQIEFYIYSESAKGWKLGSRSRLTLVSEIKLAIELATKHQVRKERL